MAANKTGVGQDGIESLKLDINGHRVHYLKAGSGPPVVLIHGGASDSRDWVGTIATLSHRYTLYAPDLIGFGRSDKNKDGYYLSEFFDFYEAFINMLGLVRPSLVGHSFGARICLEAAIKHPQNVRKLVLIDASGLGKVTRFGSAVLTVFWALRKLFKRPQPYPTFLVREGEDYNWVCVDELPNLTAPTLLVWKRHDPYLPLSIARRAEKLIPRARLVVLPGWGHAPHEQDRDAFNRLLLDFLDHD